MSEKLAKLEQFYNQRSGVPKPAFREDLTEHRTPNELLSERIPRKLLPDPTQKFAIVRFNHVQHPDDDAFAMQIIGTCRNEKEGAQITEELYGEGFRQFPMALLPLYEWRAYPPPHGETANVQKQHHQAILRTIVDRDKQSLNHEEAQMTERLKALKRDNDRNKAFREEHTRLNKESLERGDGPIEIKECDIPQPEIVTPETFEAAPAKY